MWGFNVSSAFEDLLMWDEKVLVRVQIEFDNVMWSEDAHLSIRKNLVSFRSHPREP